MEMEIDVPAPRHPLPLRRATVADAEALTRMRAMMLAAMGVDVGPEDAQWRGQARDWFRERLASPGDFAAFVVDDPELGVVSSAAGTCDRRAPGPGGGNVHGHVFNVCTDPRRARRGGARACLEALIGWFATETDARVVNLNATADGDALYRDLGFDLPRHPALQLRMAGGAPAVPLSSARRGTPVG